MKIIVTRNTFILGEYFEANRKPVDVNSKAAAEVIACRKAIAYQEPESQEPAKKKAAK